MQEKIGKWLVLDTLDVLMSDCIFSDLGELRGKMNTFKKLSGISKVWLTHQFNIAVWSGSTYKSNQVRKLKAIINKCILLWFSMAIQAFSSKFVWI